MKRIIVSLLAMIVCCSPVRAENIIEAIHAVITPDNVQYLAGLACRNLNNIVHVNIRGEWPDDDMYVGGTRFNNLNIKSQGYEFEFTKDSFRAFESYFIIDDYFFVTTTATGNQEPIVFGFSQLKDLYLLEKNTTWNSHLHEAKKEMIFVIFVFMSLLSTPVMASDYKPPIEALQIEINEQYADYLAGLACRNFGRIVYISGEINWSEKVTSDKDGHSLTFNNENYEFNFFSDKFKKKNDKYLIDGYYFVGYGGNIGGVETMGFSKYNGNIKFSLEQKLSAPEKDWRNCK